MYMKKNKGKIDLITGLDIGSSAIRVVVCQVVTGDGGKPHLRVMGATDTASEGVSRGVITSIEEVVSSISKCLEKVERLVGLPIEHAWVGVNGSNIVTQENRGIVSVTRSDGEISHEDVERVIENSRTVAEPPNYEMLHVIPKSFTVDGQEGIKDPVGMTGLRLEVDAQIIYGMSSHLKNIQKTVYRTGIDIDDMVLSVLATGEIVVTDKQKELGVAVVNIGGSTTSVVVYEGGDVQHISVLPMGSEHVTNDIAIGLKTSIDIAERVKIEFGNCVISADDRKSSINLKDIGGTDEIVSKQYVTEIIGARMGEILEKVDAELAKIDKSRMLPAGIVFTGGGAKVDSLISLAKNQLGLPATLGYPIDTPGVSNYATDLSFTTAIGLASWALRVDDTSVKRSKMRNVGNVIRGFGKVGRWFMP
jgi:cell division protein FtsA